MKKLFKNTKLIVGILLVIIVVLLIRSVSTSKVKTVQVKRVTLTNRVVSKTVSASGEVKSANQADLSFTATQLITKIYAQKGDQVKKGQLLATEDSQSILQTIQSYKDARDIALRERDLFVRNKVSNKDSLGGTDQYNIKLRENNEDISRAEAQYQAQLALLKGTYLYAPFDGTVIDVTKKEGETATTGEIVVKLADLTKLQFEMDVDQEDYGQLKNDMDSEITLDSFPNYTFKGKVFELPNYADGTSNNTFTAKLSFTDVGDKAPLLGMTGDAKVLTSTTTTEVPSLYYDELYTDEQSKPYVWVVDNGYISKLPIEIGIEGDIYTEIKSQITKQIVAPLTSDIEIKDGYKAKIVK